MLFFSLFNLATVIAILEFFLPLAEPATQSQIETVLVVLRAIT